MGIQLKGCDISKHQGEIDFNLLKNDVDFIMIRSSYGFFNEDEKAQSYINECEKYGIKYGLYHYSYARNIKECEMEVKGFIDFANRQTYRPYYPLALDMEDADNWKSENGNPSNNTYVEICEKFLSKVEEEGYYTILYANKDWFINRLNDERLIRFDKWLAHWNVKNPSLTCGMWQYSSKGKLSGIKGNVDLNFAFKDYSKIIFDHKLNKIGKPHNDIPVPPQISNEVLNYKIGDKVNFNEIFSDSYGNGLVSSKYKSGIITKIYEGRKAPYLIDNGMGYVNDELINRSNFIKRENHYVGELVHFDKLFTDSYGSHLVPSKIHSGRITKIYEGRKAPYLINNSSGFLNDDLIF